MSRPLSSDKTDKRVTLRPTTIRAFIRARLNAEDHDLPFPTLSEALDEALLLWLAAKHPESVPSPGPGRPRKRPAPPKKS